MSINRLLENIVTRSQNKVNFDFSKSFKENNSQRQSMQFGNINELPIEINDSSKWDTIHHNGIVKLHRQFIFKESQHCIYFLNEIIKESNKRNHHPKIMIDHNIIDIFLFTEDLLDVTESDISLSKFIIEIFEDIIYF